jgi:hypothetical protein
VSERDVHSRFEASFRSILVVYEVIGRSDGVELVVEEKVGDTPKGPSSRWTSTPPEPHSRPSLLRVGINGWNSLFRYNLISPIDRHVFGSISL